MAERIMLCRAWYYAVERIMISRYLAGSEGLWLCGQGLEEERVSGFRVLLVWHLAGTLMFSHLMLVDVGYWFHNFFHILCPQV